MVPQTLSAYPSGPNYEYKLSRFPLQYAHNISSKSVKQFIFIYVDKIFSTTTDIHFIGDAAKNIHTYSHGYVDLTSVSTSLLLISAAKKTYEICHLNVIYHEARSAINTHCSQIPKTVNKLDMAH